MDDDLTPYGLLIERARGKTSKRQAARDAGISEGRWRQIVTGVQKVGAGQTVRANPRRETLIAMATAVHADVNAVLEAAGMEHVGPSAQDASYVAAPGDRVEQGTSESEVLRELRAMRDDIRELSQRVAHIEQSGT